ncbi:Nitrilotriacetate monooxygenase component A/pristinamycin IIA synthase subunit A [Durotheca rogersii]|uniref:Nitrilotriacetate monooxygenase component A/pristinamycin IIA synthase subunit A n=1 Tax=Durotheca rogersii TaxID=419775 RepID=UPI00221FFBEC|nr:Nitrilotriacetate monooxygenase component A/pristinamycin IIA synthase subunit A [Durotheca rogersii]KAI5865261.1 Nitrilotriacetate monooxygenase component A/pristinamycin IIA synthase subunit A [Durotheca rogersii]
MASSNDAGGAQEAPKQKKQVLLNAFVMTTPGHLSPGLWRHPRNRTDEYNKLGFWTSLARLLDDGGFHAMFIADTLGPYDVYRGPANADPALAAGAQFPVHDPLYTVPAMAAATRNLVFGVTASTTYDPPYALARRFSTVDHLANGRVAWNIVTSYLESAARNFGLETQIEHDERYRIADEYMDVVYKLWEGSWRDDAVVRNRETGQFAVAGRVRPINHKGKYFQVPGPHIAEPSPQRTPFLFQAGTSKAGTDFGAKHAEAVFMGGQLPELVRQSVDALRQTAQERWGRDPRSIKVFTGVCVIVDETDEKARAKYRELLSYGDREGALALFGGWTGQDLSPFDDDEDLVLADRPAIRSILHRWSTTVPGSEGLKWTKSRVAEFLSVGGMMPKIIGSPKTVVDELERWVEEADVDGFNLAHAVNPGSFEDIIEFVIPELRRRGLFRTGVEREGATAREVFFGQPHLLADHPGYQFKWHVDA